MDGSHKSWDLEMMIRIRKDAGYHGFWGIESSFAAKQYRRGNSAFGATPPGKDLG